jgi:hypothetical protein
MEELEKAVDALTAGLRSSGQAEGEHEGGPRSGEHAEDTYEALKTYGLDLVAIAESGKLDPVIGRDAGTVFPACSVHVCMYHVSRMHRKHGVLAHVLQRC